MSLVEFPTAQPASRPTPRPGPSDVLAHVDEYWGLAQRIAATEFVPKGLQRRPEAVLAALLTGAERGLGPMMSLSQISIIEGRPSLSAEAMRALVFAAGHEIEILETTAQKASVTGRRAGATTGSPPFTWTLDRARRANLVNKDNWRKYPEAMLLARATADLCRALFPDVIAGLAISEELVDENEAAPATATVKPRGKQAAVAPTTSGELPAPIEADVVDESATGPQAEQESGRSTGSSPVPARPPAPRSHRAERSDMEAPPIDVDEIPGADTPSWAPDPRATSTAADPGLARRIHAEIRAVLPATMAPGDVDLIRHALVAVVTRRRPDGPVTSSNDLDHSEQLALSELLERAKAGTASIVKGPDGTLELRAHGWRYTIVLDPVAVEIARVEPEAGDE